MPYKLTKLVHTGSACPSQWEAELEDGRHVYIRYRWGFLRATAGRTMDDAITVGSASMMAHIEMHRLAREGALEDKSPDELDDLFTTKVEERQAKADDGEWLYGVQVGDEYDGMMGTSTMLDHLKNVLTR